MQVISLPMNTGNLGHGPSAPQNDTDAPSFADELGSKLPLDSSTKLHLPSGGTVNLLPTEEEKGKETSDVEQPGIVDGLLYMLPAQSAPLPGAGINQEMTQSPFFEGAGLVSAVKNPAVSPENVASQTEKADSGVSVSDTELLPSPDGDELQTGTFDSSPSQKLNKAVAYSALAGKVGKPIAHLPSSPPQIQGSLHLESATNTDKALPQSSEQLATSLDSAVANQPAEQMPVQHQDSHMADALHIPTIGDMSIQIREPVGVSPSAQPSVLTASVGTTEWQQNLSQQLACFTREGIHHAELRLHPEDLGSLHISLRINNDQVQLHFAAADHQVRNALETAMPHLRNSLAESGISLGQTNVAADSRPSWENGSHNQSAEQDMQSEDGTEIVPDEPGVILHTLSRSGGINTFV
ncbi:flagellar hook-length control protein FliK [Escherichia marmotae]|uniref:flagellar hook-length control protein FliK n=1 Tax=Escherichia marmotae TaxID=1499973 RepID=UPI003CEB49D9